MDLAAGTGVTDLASGGATFSAMGAGSTDFAGTGGAGSMGFVAGAEAVIVKFTGAGVVGGGGAGRGATGLGSSGMRTMSPGETLGELAVSNRSTTLESGGAERSAGTGAEAGATMAPDICAAFQRLLSLLSQTMPPQAPRPTTTMQHSVPPVPFD